MPYSEHSDIEDLLHKARGGDATAVGELLERYRRRLRHMVAVRMDPCLAPRLDPSDVVQEALTVASRRLREYLENPALDFYPWLRQIAWDRLLDTYRRHVRAGNRSVYREEPLGMSDTSALALADRIVAESTSLLKRLLRRELLAQVRAALLHLTPQDQEVLILRYLEELSTAETAAVLQISETATKQRLLRAVQRLRERLEKRY